MHTVAHELLHVDGSVWRTLRLLFVRPGRLSLEYAAGRRVPTSIPSACCSSRSSYLLLIMFLVALWVGIELERIRDDALRIHIREAWDLVARQRKKPRSR